MMRHAVLTILSFFFLYSAVFANGDDAFHLAIKTEHPSAKTEQAQSMMWTMDGSNLHGTDIDGLSFWRERRTIETLKIPHRQIRLKEHLYEGIDNLPEMDWDPDAGYKVFRAGKRWGACFEFSHAGLGKSGKFQRWSSIVLVPWKREEPGEVAHRFVGYWPSCADLVEGKKAGEVLLPTIEFVKKDPKHLQLFWNHCTIKGCTKVKDPRTIVGSPYSETGELKFKHP